MGARGCKCVTRDEGEMVKASFADEWWRKYDKDTNEIVTANERVYRLPLRFEGTALTVYGLVDQRRMWAQFRQMGEPYVPVLVGGKAVVSICFHKYVSTDLGGAYLETSYNTFVTDKGDEPEEDHPLSPAVLYNTFQAMFTPQTTQEVAEAPEVTPRVPPPVDVPYETPFSLRVQNANVRSYVLRGVCSEDAPVHTGAGAAAIEIERSFFGLPVHPDAGKIVVGCNDEKTHLGIGVTLGENKPTVVRIKIPQEGSDGTVTSPVEVEMGPDSVLGAPLRAPHVVKKEDLVNRKKHTTAFKCTQHAQAWDTNTDSLDFGNDSHYALPIQSWNFKPLLKVYSPDFNFIRNNSGSPKESMAEEKGDKFAAQVATDEKDFKAAAQVDKGQNSSTLMVSDTIVGS